MERVNLNNKWNYRKKDGTYLSEIWFENVGYFHDNVVRVKIQNDWYELDHCGNMKFCCTISSSTKFN